MKEKYLLKTALVFSAVLLIHCKGNSERFQTDTPRTPLKEYTRDDPGEWAGKEDEHYPRLSLDSTKAENVVILVKFPIKHEPDHYIEKIGIMDSDGKDIVVKRFNPSADFFQARFSIPFIGKGWKAYARCSLHDLWVTPIEP
jgi:desulfoferrodoxin (superoxide reductase-like protein)